LKGDVIGRDLANSPFEGGQGDVIEGVPPLKGGNKITAIQPAALSGPMSQAPTKLCAYSHINILERSTLTTKDEKLSASSIQHSA